MLYRSTDRLSRAGASVQYLAHSASFHSVEKIAPSKPGTKHLPAQNATGNWVKVTQRLPVRIAFDHAPPEVAGRAGLSAHVKVDVRAPGKKPA